MFYSSKSYMVLLIDRSTRFMHLVDLMRALFCNVCHEATNTKVCRWVPELQNLPTKYIHAPWETPTAAIRKAGVTLGVTYPHRVTTRDMRELRAENVASLRAARESRRQSVPEDVDGGGYDVIKVPQGAARGVRGGRVRVFTVPGLRSAESNSTEFSSFRNKFSAGKAPAGRGFKRGGGYGRKNLSVPGSDGSKMGADTQAKKFGTTGKQTVLPFVPVKGCGS